MEIIVDFVNVYANELQNQACIMAQGLVRAASNLCALLYGEDCS